MRRTWPAKRRFRSAGRRSRSTLARVMDVLFAAVVLALLALVAGRLERLNTANPSGVARIADGDSLELAGERIRLRGIDAPEFNQKCRRGAADYPCGKLARQALQQLVAGREVSCSGRERDRYDRLLAVCRAGDVELNRRQVADGWAVAYGDYELEEGTARAGRLGIWSGEFELPADWRVTHGELAEPPHDMLGSVGDWLRRLLGF